MNTSRNIPGFVYKLMLLAATIIWGIAFVVMKDAVDVLPPAQLIGVRFLLTGLLMAAVFHRSLRGTLNGPCLRAGLVLALVTFLAFWVQTIGLADTTPGKNAFLTATYCVIVPFLLWIVARKRPTLANVGAAVLCIAGIGLVSMTAGSFRLEFGDLMTLLCAVFFAAQIIAISHYAQQFNVLALTVYQFLFGGLMGLVLGGLTEPAPTLAVLTPDFLFNLFYLVVFASGLCYLFQNVGLAHVAPAQGSLLLSLESVFGVLASVLLYGEVVTGRMMLGFVLIFAAILISELAPTLKAKRLEQKRQPEAAYDPEEECAPIG
ncbi:DMT family transporter [Adlercreutzia equolifaciens]|uniref:DMT family transporter n=1 Tax=Adlercreutzia equolifaciens TaxID=446660 RepID=UPI0023AF5BEE|nr:DMT family transporter [Adlercreutzia equolifaciens]MDE8702218.1 DMT family transporter [Adlercreutzia equolifaciens]